MTQKRYTLLKVGRSQHITGKNINQQQPQIVYNAFQNQKEEKVFEKVRDHRLDIKFDHLQRTTKHVMQAHGIVELNEPVKPYF